MAVSFKQLLSRMLNLTKNRMISTNQRSRWLLSQFWEKNTIQRQNVSYMEGKMHGVCNNVCKGTFCVLEAILGSFWSNSMVKEVLGSECWTGWWLVGCHLRLDKIKKRNSSKKLPSEAHLSTNDNLSSIMYYMVL